MTIWKFMSTLLSNNTLCSWSIVFLPPVKYRTSVCYFSVLLSNVCLLLAREYELMTEAHAQLSVEGNCSRFSLHVCLGEGKPLAGGRW
jgi:hypothetical protein